MSHRHSHQPLLLGSDMALSVSSDWDLTIDPGDRAGHSGQVAGLATPSRLPFSIMELPCLFLTLKLLHLFLAHPTHTSYLHIVVAPTTG